LKIEIKVGNIIVLFKKSGISYKSRDKTVGIANSYRLDDQGVGVKSPGGGKNFHFYMSSKPTLGSTQPLIT
jgi:hypothetical protein